MPNHPTVLTAPANPTAKAGQTFTLTLSATDDDSPRVDGLVSSWGDSATSVASDPWYAFDRCRTAYGPWDLPPASPGKREWTESHVFDRPGQYTVTVAVYSAYFSRDDHAAAPGGSEYTDGTGTCLDPYRGIIRSQINVTVTS